MKTIVAALLVMGCYSLANCKLGLDDPFEIKWVWINTTTVASAKTTYNFEPAGYEGPGVTSYLCRANVVDQSGTKNWLPGKQIGDRCFVQRDDPQTEFQIPDMPLGSTSWIPLPHFDPRTIPSKAVIGGRHWDGEIAFICRAYFWEIDTGYTIPGTYHPSQNICYIPYGGDQIAWRFGPEILALNSYGISIWNSRQNAKN